MDNNRYLTEMLEALRELEAKSQDDVPPAHVDLNLVLRSAVCQLGTLLCETNTKLQSTRLPVVWASNIQMQLLMEHLIANAALFGGSEISITCEELAPLWVIAVKDNGPGIPLEIQKKIFGAFESPGPPYSLPGPGLALCRRVVERHGGQLWVESDSKSGSSFFFSLPRA